jgi:MFS family permease
MWWFVTVAIVTACTGFFLLVGFTVAAGVHHADPGIPDNALAVIYAVGAIGGVWVGAWLSRRFTRGSRRRFVGAGIGGVVGLAGGVALPSLNAFGLAVFLPLLAVLLPGIGAAAGSAIANRTAKSRTSGSARERSGGPPAVTPRATASISPTISPRISPKARPRPAPKTPPRPAPRVGPQAPAPARPPADEPADS